MLLTQVALASSCTGIPDVRTEMASSDAVFEGRVAWIDEGIATFDVHRWWAGSGGKQAVIWPIGLEPIRVGRGQTWVVYASERHGVLTAYGGTCGRSTMKGTEREVQLLPEPIETHDLPPYVPTALEAAVRSGNADGARKALAAGDDAGEPLRDGLPLALAIAACDAPVVEVLARADAKGWGPLEALLQCPDNKGAEVVRALNRGFRRPQLEQTLVHEAARNLELVHLLLEGGVSAHAVSLRHGGSALGEAMAADRSEIATLLRQRGATYDLAVLRSLARNSDPEVRRRAVEARLTPEMATVLLQDLIVFGDEGVLKRLLDAGADPSGIGEGTAPLVTAIRRKWPLHVDRLLEAGAVPNGEALHQALIVHKGDPELIERLLSAGANPNLWPDARGRPDMSPLEKASEYQAPLATIELLLNAGASTEVCNRDLGSAIALAAKRDQDAFEAVRMLLEAGSEPYEALVWARDPAVIDLLLAAGATPDASHRGTHPLSNAAMDNDVPRMRKLIEAGATLDVVGGLGQSLLMLAALNNAEESVRYLLELGVSTNLRDHEGRTAADYAGSRGHDSLAKRLRDLE